VTATSAGISAATGARLEYQPALDGIRALSVLAVVAYHADFSWARGGFLGVDAFFVLSGYLITSLLVLEWRRHGTISLLAFWGRRVRRLLPALLLIVLFIALCVVPLMAPVERGRIRGDGLAALFYVANWRYVLSGQSYFELFVAPSPLRHVWSLAIEEQFYLVWPLVVFASLRIARGSVRLLAMLSFAGIIASTVAMAVLYDGADPSRSYYGTDTRAHTLLVGALAALVLLNRRPIRPHAFAVRQWLGGAAGLAVLWAWHGTSDTGAALYHGGLLVFAVAVALVIAASTHAGALQRTLSIAPLAWIGRLSYGVYLWHWVLQVWLTPARVGLDGLPLTAVRVGATFGAATASYYLVELPIRLHRARRRAGLFLVRATSVVAAGAVASAVVVSTSSAADPPSHMGVMFGQPSPGPPPRESEMQAAVDANRHGATPAPAAAAGSGRSILLLGDSTACSLYPGLRVVAAAAGHRVEQGTIAGCGIVSDEVTSLRGERLPVLTGTCHELVHETALRALERTRPDVVIWMSIWEKSDLRLNGGTIAAGTPEGDAEVVARMEAMVARLTAGGARVVMVTVPPRTEGTAFGSALTTTPEDDAEYVRLNRLLARFAREHPREVSLVDLAAKVCRCGPPCPTEVDGFTPRLDGSHYSPAGAVWLSRWLLPRLLAAAGDAA
jgi:peptidoglycan/LPS O-acetylase OafA/YrhL